MTEPKPTPTIAQVRRWLGEIPDMCTLLPDALVTRSARSESRRPVPSSRPPYDVGITDLADRRTKHDWTTGSMAWCDPDRMGVLPFLDSWVRDLEAAAIDGDPIFGIQPRHDLPPAAPETPTVAAVCDWLARELEWAETLPQWPELADGIRHTHRRLRSATASVRDREERPVPCQRCGEGKLRQVEGARPLWACDRCDAEVSIQAVTLQQAAKIVRVPERTLRDWSHRQALLSPVGDGPRSRLYDLGQIRALVAERRLREGA